MPARSDSARFRDNLARVALIDHSRPQDAASPGPNFKPGGIRKNCRAGLRKNATFREFSHCSEARKFAISQKQCEYPSPTLLLYARADAQRIRGTGGYQRNWQVFTSEQRTLNPNGVDAPKRSEQHPLTDSTDCAKAKSTIGHEGARNSKTN